MKLWQDGKIETLFARPGLNYQRLTVDPKTKSGMLLDMLFLTLQHKSM